jgi:COP9 signalosome complex subunit 1
MASKQEVGTSIEKKEDKKEVIQVQLSPGEFELEAYITNYAGHTKIARLLFVTEHCKSLEADSLKLAIDLLKKTTNTLLYKNVTEKVGMTLGSGYAIDQSWIDGTEKKAIQQQEKLEADLNQFRTNLIKESIRVFLLLKVYLF